MRQRKLMNEINVVPYIDVMLVLLVIFMVTAPMLNPTIVELPSVGKSTQVPETPLEVIVKSDASMVLRERLQGKSVDRDVDMRALVDVVKNKQASSPEQAVVISADKDVRYEHVAQAMAAAQRAGVRKIGFVTEPQP